MGDLFVKFFENIGRVFSSNKVLYGLIMAMVMLPLALLVIPTMNSTSASGGNDANIDPMTEIISTRDVEVEEELTQPTLSGGTITRTDSQNVAVSDTPTQRSGNYLSIPGKVSASVVGVGLDASGAIAVPGSAIGMYSQGGATFLDGHSTGVFSGLNQVRVGDIAEFTLNSVTARYQVVNVVTYTYFDGKSFDKSFMYDALYSGGANGLNMMTCSGAYLPNYGTYSHRLVVYSVRI